MNRSVAVASLLILAAMTMGAMLFEPGNRRKALAFYAAWLAPGVGHLVLGRWGKALSLFGLHGFLLVTGLALCGWRTVGFEDNPFYYVGQFGSGLTVLLGQLLSSPKAYPIESLPPSWFDPGLLYVCVAGLLNVVVMVSVFDVRRDPAASGAPAAEPAAPAPEPVVKP